MLVRIILLPSILTSIPEDRASFYSLAIKLLQELEKTGVILVDDKECIKTALSQRIRQWPVKFRKPVQVLLEELWKNHRFVEVSLTSDIQSSCRRKQCQQCIKIAKEYLPMAVLARQECNSCANKQLTEVPTVKVIDVEEYSLDDDFRSYLDERGCVLGNAEWKQDKFEQEILIPLFRDAKNIKIYDRWSGRSILTPNADKYKLTLEWILDVFLGVSRLGSGGIFEVYSGFCTQKKPGKRSPDVSNAVVALRQLEADMQQAHPKFRLIIKNETRNKQLPHHRYLITNQVAVSIDRGFDLLLGKATSLYPRRLRDVHIAYCSEPGKVEQAVRGLPDL
jgi:hypothetical protein